VAAGSSAHATDLTDCEISEVSETNPLERDFRSLTSHLSQYKFEAFIQFVEGFLNQFPQVSYDIKRTVAEGDLVALHSLLKTSPEDRGTAAADFFRLEDGEHWDVLQPIPESATNEHPMF
jgi:predicted SnoaL-like aldol condensation-catalyzing enzyme